MKLPRTIRREIVEYLHLEFGESANDPEALKASDLAYEGRHDIQGVATHFWAYPSGAGKHWATVQERGKTYCLGTSTTGPHGETADLAKALKWVRVEFRSDSEKAKPMKSVRRRITGDVELPIKFPDGNKLDLSVEVYDATDRPDVAISITDKSDRGLYVRCTSGVVVSYDAFGYQCLISVGTGPWEGN